MKNNDHSLTGIANPLHWTIMLKHSIARPYATSYRSYGMHVCAKGMHRCHRYKVACEASIRCSPDPLNRPLLLKPAETAAHGGDTVDSPTSRYVALASKAASGRRSALATMVALHAWFGKPLAANAAELGSVIIKPEQAPDQSKYNPADPVLRKAANMLQLGLNAETVEAEEATWTQIINEFSNVQEPWTPDVVGRAWGNRGNARSRQGKLEAALQDYNEAIRICPWSPDPVLNRGVVLEALGRYEEAIQDYRSVLAVLPNDPAAWNNLGNATAGLGRWDEAAQYYGRAVLLAPEFSFAAANKALALYQLGDTNQSIREMRALLRKYPEFPDMRAALAAALWAEGLEAQAEGNWDRVDDPRYKDRSWLQKNRRWPPKLTEALWAFLDIKSVKPAAPGQ